VEGRALLTPPADGRILPGVTRAALLAAERYAREEPIELERLAGADAVFLTSSISLRRAARLAG
jgi:para-aminobenzoate synthetase/4-amino-4-deoxychorismate lyase